MALSKPNQDKLRRAEAAQERLPPEQFLSWLRGFTKDHPRVSRPLMKHLVRMKEEARNALR